MTEATNQAAPSAGTDAAPAAPAAPASLANDALFGKPAGAGEHGATAGAAPAATDGDAKPQDAPNQDAAEQPAKIPGKDATPEEWAAFYKQLGAPEKAEDYAVTVPEGADPAETALIQGMFKKANLLPEQAKALLEVRNELYAKQSELAKQAEEKRIAAIETANKQQASELAAEWGAKATENMELARRGVTQFIDGGQEKQQAVILAMEQALGYKETIKFFHGIGRAIGEHDAAGLGSNNGVAAGRKSSAEALYPSMFQKS